MAAEQQESDEPSRQHAQSVRHEHDASPRETVGDDAADQQDLVALGGALLVFGAVEILQLPGPPS